jgi:DNA-binding transcriptional MerR regulator
MKIKEVEEKLGIDRETIRFYIREGLLSPVQHDNHHREYSEEDIDQIKRIRILRQLEMSISQTRSVFNGEMDFNTALDESRRILEHKREIVSKSISTCMDLKDKDPRAFDPGPYYIDDSE